MDEKSLGELLECSVCLNQLDATSKVLPCQHTFCRQCLEEIVSTKKVLCCPECRAPVVARINELPSNILLIRLLEGIKSAAVKTQVPVSMHNTATKTTPSLTYVSPKDSQSSSNCTPSARALYNYEAREPGDLTFKKGDVILLKRHVDDNWYEGQLGEQCGLFPLNYVQVLAPLPAQDTTPSCKALYDFVSNDQRDPDCLTFHKGDMITVVRRIDDNWAEGRLGDRLGIFPLSFVQMNEAILNALGREDEKRPTTDSSVTSQHANEPVGNTQETNEPSVNTPQTSGPPNTAPRPAVSAPSKQVPSPTQSSLFCSGDLLNSAISRCLSLLTTSSHHQSKMSHTATSNTTTPQSTTATSSTVPQNTVVTRSSAKDTTQSSARPQSTVVPQGSVASQSNSKQRHSYSGCDDVQRKPGSDAADTSSSKPPSIYMALYSYRPQKKDELHLQKGLYYTVIERCQDGWYKGACLHSGEKGVFPGNYVQFIKLPATKSSSPPSQPAESADRSLLYAAQTVALPPPNNTTSVSRHHSFPKTSPAVARIRPYTAAKDTDNIPTGAAAEGVTDAQRVSNARQPAVETVREQPEPRSGNIAETVDVSGSKHSRVSHRRGVSNNNAMPSQSLSPRPAVSSASNSPRSVNNNKAPKLPVSEAQTEPNMGRAAQRAVQKALTQAAVRNTSQSGTRVTSQGQKSGSQGQSGVKSSSQGASAVRVSSAARPSSLGDIGGGDSTGAAAAQEAPVCVGASGDSATSRSKEKRSKDRAVKKRSVRSHERPSTSAKSSAGGTVLEAAPVTGRASSHRKSASLEAPVTLNNEAPPSQPAKSSSKKSRDRCRCVVPYPAQSDTELDLISGDILCLVKKRHDGWLKGTSLRTGKTGLFPASFVQQL